MKDFAKDFYLSTTWERTRESYFKSKQGLCEICLEQGLIVPGEIVHHKIHLTPMNINDPEISLSWDNLQLVCREHHAVLHKKTAHDRYTFGPNGEIIPQDYTPPLL